MVVADSSKHWWRPFLPLPELLSSSAQIKLHFSSFLLSLILPYFSSLSSHVAIHTSPVLLLLQSTHFSFTLPHVFFSLPSYYTLLLRRSKVSLAEGLMCTMVSNQNPPAPTPLFPLLSHHPVMLLHYTSHQPSYQHPFAPPSHSLSISIFMSSLGRFYLFWQDHQNMFSSLT
jgi:hypothetical protein